MLSPVLPTLHMSCGRPFGVHRGRSRTALHSSDRCRSVPFCLRLCGFISLCLPCFLSLCFPISPRSTQNSQATPLVEAQTDGNPPYLPGENSVPVSRTLPPGASTSSVAANPSSQLSPEFLATVVHAVKAALVAEQASVPGSAPPSLPVQGASSSMNSSAVPTFGGVPSLLSSQATAFAASGSGFSVPSTSAGASAAQGRPAFVVPTFVSTFLPPTPSHSLSLPTMAPLLSQDSVRPLSHCIRLASHPPRRFPL